MEPSENLADGGVRADVLPGDPVVQVRRLTKSYGAVHAVREMDLDVRRGECVAVVGPNGAGKTTLIEILEGYRQTDAGTALVLGENPARAGASWRERIGIVSQRSGPVLGMTVAETITHWAGFYRAGRDPGEVIATVGLEHKARALVSSLSGGLRRRLEFALAIVGRPELLFLDEPTAALDPAARRGFWELIRGLKAAGTTIMLTTHNLQEAAELADRLVVVVAGQLVAVASPEELGAAASTQTLVRWREDGVRREEHTDNPTAAVLELARRLGGAVDGLEVVRPGLEDAYLEVLRTLGSEVVATGVIGRRL